eukprot:1148090-Pelagomonas_calceolata.AAC.3
MTWGPPIFIFFGEHRKKGKKNYVGIEHSLHQLRKGGHIGAQTVRPTHHEVQTERSTAHRERRQVQQREEKAG